MNAHRHVVGSRVDYVGPEGVSWPGRHKVEYVVVYVHLDDSLDLVPLHMPVGAGLPLMRCPVTEVAPF